MHLEVVLIGHRHAVEIGRSSHSVYSNMSRLQKIGKENSSFFQWHKCNNSDAQSYLGHHVI